MTTRTLSQPHDPCRALVLETLANTPAPLTFFALRDLVRAAEPFTPTRIRATLAKLVTTEMIDSEHPLGGGARVYFLVGRAPRVGAIFTFASQAPRIAIDQRTWFSPLGLAA